MTVHRPHLDSRFIVNVLIDNCQTTGLQRIGTLGRCAQSKQLPYRKCWLLLLNYWGKKLPEFSLLSTALYLCCFVVCFQQTVVSREFYFDSAITWACLLRWASCTLSEATNSWNAMLGHENVVTWPRWRLCVFGVWFYCAWWDLELICSPKS